MDQSYICGVERGRRGTPRPEVVDQLAAAVDHGLPGAVATSLRWAAAHDRVIQALLCEELRGAEAVVSMALRARQRLAPEELAGLVAYVKALVDSKDRLDRVAGRIPVMPGEELAM